MRGLFFGVGSFFAGVILNEIALFLQPLFWEASKPFSYDDKWGKEAMEHTPIMLPTDPQGNPDWGWMHRYMARMLHDTEHRLETYNHWS